MDSKELKYNLVLFISLLKLVSKINHHAKKLLSRGELKMWNIVYYEYASCKS